MTDSSAVESIPGVLVGNSTEDGKLHNDMTPQNGSSGINDSISADIDMNSNGDNGKKRSKENDSSSHGEETTTVQNHKRPRTNHEGIPTSSTLDTSTSSQPIIKEIDVESTNIDGDDTQMQPSDEHESDSVTKGRGRPVNAAATTTISTTVDDTTTGYDSSPLVHGNVKKRSRRRWRAHQMAEDYVDFVGNMMYPGIMMGPYGYNAPHENQYPLERITSLGYLQSPLRRPTVIEMWSPYEIAMFEAALFQYGKLFHKIQKEVSTKTTKDVVEFYYVWKKTSHYQKWKDQYTPGMGDSSDEEEKEETKNDGGRRRV